MFCPKCGKENSDSSKFCANCGTNIEIVAASKYHSHSGWHWQLNDIWQSNINLLIQILRL